MSMVNNVPNRDFVASFLQIPKHIIILLKLMSIIDGLT